MSTLYDRLEVQKGATTEDIKKAYMKMARKHHPDKGGDAELFKGVQEAYEVLTDDRRRQVYDHWSDCFRLDQAGSQGLHHVV
jgi:DnaJ-class molecular chaperone